MRGRGFMNLSLDKGLLADIYVLYEKNKKALAIVSGLLLLMLVFASVKQVFYDIPQIKGQISNVEREISKYRAELNRVRSAKPLPPLTWDKLPQILRSLEFEHDLTVISRTIRERKYADPKGFRFQVYSISTFYRYTDPEQLKEFLKEVNKGWFVLQSVKKVGKNIEVKIDAYTK